MLKRRLLASVPVVLAIGTIPATHAAPCTGTPVTTDMPAAPGGVAMARPVEALAFSPDGKLLVAGDAAGTVCLRRIENGRDAGGRELGSHDGPVTAVAFIADGSRVVSAGADGALRIWDPANGELLHAIEQAPVSKRRFEPPPGYARTAITSVAVARSDEQVVTGNWDGRVRVWNAGSGELVRELARLHFPVTAVALSPDGRIVAAASTAELEIHLFDLVTGETARIGGFVMSAPAGMAFAPDGSRVIAVDGRGKVFSSARLEPGRYDFAFGPGKPVDFPCPARAVAVSPDGAAAFVACGGGNAGRLLVADTERNTWRVVRGRDGDTIEALAVTADGETIASGSAKGRILLWSLKAMLATPILEPVPKPTIPDAYRAFLDAGCDPAGISTAIEARVLRNLPFALAGRSFKSEELRILYLADGDWYRPDDSRKITISAEDTDCVARLKRHEDFLREYAGLDPRIEKMLTESPEIFHALQGLDIPGLRLRDGWQSVDGDGASWEALCNRGCRTITIECRVLPSTGALDCRVSKIPAASR